MPKGAILWEQIESIILQNHMESGACLEYFTSLSPLKDVSPPPMSLQKTVF